MKLSEELTWRGQIKDKTFDDLAWLDSPKAFYLGVDCGSSSSMTIGNLAIFMLVRRLADAGWNVVIVVGGGTSQVGDAGGKTEERPLVPKDVIAANVEGIRLQVERLLGDKPFTMVNNADWLEPLTYLDFLRDIGKYFSISELMQRDFVVERLGAAGSGISYAEFSYSLVQGYDYWHLFKSHGVQLQIGGSDQWGNLLSGVGLIRRKEAAEVHALSAPLVINKATGKKFGKSEDGAVWLDETMTSVYKFYQFWLNVDDEGVIDYMKVYTLLNKDEIDKIAEEFEQNKSARLAQKTLAYEVTSLVHGKDRAESVKRISEVLFGGRDYADLTPEDFGQLKTELPFAEGPESSILEVVAGSDLASSKSEARRFIESKAIYLNGKQIDADKATIAKDDTIDGYVIIRRGKNQHVLYRLV